MSPIDTTSPLGVTLALLPEVILSLAALGVLLVNAWRHETAADSRLAGWLSLGGVGASLLALVWLWNAAPGAEGIPQMVALDSFRYLGNLLFLLAAAATIVFSFDYLEREGIRGPEYYTLILLATVGMMLLGGASDLIMVFLGLEVMSVAAYVLAALRPPQSVLRRGGPEVLPDRRVRLGIPPVRNRPGLRVHRHHQSRHGRYHLHLGRVPGHGRPRAEPVADRLPLQGVGRAVPHVGARRL